jgi:hypothetical protein
VSTYWSYRCTTCEVDCGERGVNHGQRELRNLARLGPHLAALRAADVDGLVETRTWSVDESDLAFLAEHGSGEHLLELVSEYGDVEPLDLDAPCLEALDFAGLAEPPTCSRSRGHPGKHEARVTVRVKGPVVRCWTARW